MTVTFRNAVDADLAALIRLNAQVQRLHAQVYPADFKSLTDEGEVRDFLASVMRQTDHTILLAQLDGGVRVFQVVALLDLLDRLLHSVGDFGQLNLGNEVECVLRHLWSRLAEP